MARIIQLRVHRLCLILLVFFSVVGCDQSSKVLAREVLPKSGPVQLLGEHLTLTLSQNIGAFLSLGADWSLQSRILIFQILSGLFLLVFAFYLFSRTWGANRTLAASLIVAGGVGNLIDRVLFGSVTDFLYLEFGRLHTGIFNVADVAIVAGSLWLVWLTTRQQPRKVNQSHG